MRIRRDDYRGVLPLTSTIVATTWWFLLLFLSRNPCVTSLAQQHTPERTQLGTLSVSPMGLGMLNLPLDRDTDPDTTAVLRKATSMGINLADTAEAYGFGKSETLTRNAIQDAAIADDSTNIQIATKFAPVPWRPDGQSVVEACRASRERLGVEKIPLYQIHFPDIIQPFRAFGLEKRKDELYWQGLAECYRSGLVENVGVSNYGPELLLRASEVLSKYDVPLVSNQINLSLARYRSSTKTLETCDELGVRVLAYFPLANGLLAGKYSVENPPKFPKSLTMKKYYEGTAPTLEVLKRISQERNKSVAQVSINWVMSKGAIPIPGARNAQMAEDNFGAMGWSLSEEEVNMLDEASARSEEFSSGGFELV